MLVLLQHLQPGTDVSLEELASTVGATPEQVAEDVTTLSLCGVAPYDPLNLVSAFVDEGRVVVMGPPPALERPIRLSPAEARALATALQSAGFDAHADLTERLMGAASREFSIDELAQRVRSAGPAPAEAVYETLASATMRHEVVTIEYQRAGGTATTSRDVEPRALFNDRGVWYLSAYCRSANGDRTFRVDRIKAAEATGVQFDTETTVAEGVSFSGDGLPVARLVFDDATEYSKREWPGSRAAGPVAEDGTLAVDVPYSGTAWIARQVCARLGTVRVQAPEEVRDAVVRTAEKTARELGDV
jgi:proteasome accessory factor C